MSFFGGREDEDKRRQKNGQTLNVFFLPKLPFWDISTFTFYAWSVLLVHIRFTPSEGPKGFINCFLSKKSDHGRWTMEKCHLPLSIFMVHGINWPSVSPNNTPRIWTWLCILTLNCLISVGYHLELRVAINLYQHHQFLPSKSHYIFDVHINYSCSLSKKSHAR